MERGKKTGFSIEMGPVQLIMVVALIVGAYFLGSLVTKVEYLQKGVATTTTTQPTTNTAGTQPQQPLTAGDVPKITADDWVKGNRNANIALIEYSDLECPFCKQFHPTAQQVVDTYGDKIMWVYRHYPLSFHQNAEKEAEAAECAGSLGGNDAFWKFADTIYERTTSNGTGFALDKLEPLAVEIGLDGTKFQQCLDSGKFAQKVKDQEDGGTKAGITGTPGNIVMNIKTGDTRLIPGAVPFADMKTAIDELMAK